MVYERFVKQLDGCVLCGGKAIGGLNCTCAAEAMWLYRASQGKIVTTACHVRDLTDDCVDGTHLGQMEDVSKHYGITAGKVFVPATTTLILSLIATNRYGAHWSGSYSPLSGTRYDCFSGRFKGNHDWYVSGPGKAAGTTRVGDPGADGRRSGIPSGFQDIPTSLMVKAAGLLDVGGHPLGAGKVYAYLTPPDPAALSPKRHASVIHPTSVWNDGTKKWVYGDPAGPVDNRVKVGTALIVRTATYIKGGVPCYPIDPSSPNYARYYVPKINVKLGAPV